MLVILLKGPHVLPAQVCRLVNFAAQDATTPDAYLFSALFSACAAGRTPDLLDLAARAEADMHVRWSSQKSQPRQQKQ